MTLTTRTFPLGYLSVFGPVWPRGAEEGGAVSEARRGGGRGRRGRLCGGQAGGDEGVQQGVVRAHHHVVQQPLDPGRRVED